MNNYILKIFQENESLIRKEIEEDISVDHEGYFLCSMCEHKRKQKYHVYQHVQAKHLEVKFDCSQCKCTFTYIHDLRKHVKLVHGESQPYRCENCDYSSFYRSTFQRHLQNIHSSPEIDNKICDYKFNTLKNLQKHTRTNNE